MSNKIADFLLLEWRLPDGKIEYAERAVQAAKLGWEDSGNPVYAWIAYRECRAADLTVPEWVLENFDRNAAAIWALCQSPPAKNKIAPAIAEAFGFKTSGARSAFARVRDREWLYLAGLVALYIKQGDKEYMAVDEVARRNNTSPATIRRAWRRYKTALS